jgi:hypothetical protein
MPHLTQERREGEATTRKSRSREADGHCLADLPPLARGSLYLGLIMALGGPSCLLTQNPEFDGPQAVGPFIQAGTPDPGSVLAVGFQIGSTRAYAPQKVSFYVYSEDLGRPLYAALYLDGAPIVGAGKPIAPGHLAGGDDGGLAQKRPVSIPFTIPSGTPRGCHVLTLNVTHDITIVFRKDDTINADDLASVSWIVDLADGDPANPPNLLSNCPQVTVTP